MENIFSQLGFFLNVVGPFFILLGVLIFVHEFGHFIVARFFGVRVETFSLGFGKKILSYRWGETLYCLSIIPLGGYVKMYGDDPTKEVPEIERRHSFLHQPVFARMAIVAAGPLINLLFAVVVFAMVSLIGESVPSTKLGDIEADKAAYAFGFRSGDTILEVDGQAVRYFPEVTKIIERSAERNLSFVVEREGTGLRETIVARPVWGRNDNILSAQDQVGRVDGLSTLAMAAIAGVADKDSPAFQAGLRGLFMIESVNGEKVEFFRQLDAILARQTAPIELVLSSFTGDDQKKPPQTITLRFPYAVAESGASPSLAARLGFTSPELFLGRVKRDSPADRAGLRAGDRLLSVSGKTIENWEQVLEQVKSFDDTKPGVVFEVMRDGEKLALTPRPQMDQLMNQRGQEEKRFTVGIMPALVMTTSQVVTSKASGLGAAVGKGIEESVKWTQWTLMSFVRLIQNEVSPKNIGGVITIGRVAAQSFEVGLSAFLKMMGIISINLFILNLLPVPVLDGGHLVFFSIEALRGAPLSLRKMEIAQTVGLVLLMSLMLFAFYNDISNWLQSAGW